MGSESDNSVMVKAIFGTLVFFMLISIAAITMFSQGARKTPEDVYRLHFTAPIDAVKIIDGGGFTWQGGVHFLKFSGPEPVALKNRDLFKEIPMASEAARKGMKSISDRFTADQSLFSESGNIQCLYLSNPGNHNEKWPFTVRERPMHFFHSYTY